MFLPAASQSIDSEAAECCSQQIGRTKSTVAQTHHKFILQSIQPQTKKFLPTPEYIVQADRLRAQTSVEVGSWQQPLSENEDESIFTKEINRKLRPCVETQAPMTSEEIKKQLAV